MSGQTNCKSASNEAPVRRLVQKRKLSDRTDVFSATKRSEIMQGIRTTGTQPESLVHSILDDLGYSYITNQLNLPGKPDVVFAQDTKAVFIHGCFWHGHTECKKGQTMPKANRTFWRTKISNNVARDRRTLAELRKMGWFVLTIWECQLKNRKKASARLVRFIKRKPGSRLGAKNASKT